MVLVRGQDALSVCQVGEESTWGTAATTFYTVPLTLPGESFVLKRDQFQQAREFGGIGAREAIEYGRSSVEGSLTVTPRYEGRWFHILMAHALWSETVVVDTHVDGTTITAPDSGNLHIYAPSATPPVGMTFRIWKGGPGPVGSSTWDIFVGCLVTSFTIEQPEDDILRFTFNWVGKSVSTATASGSPAAIAGVQLFGARHASTALGGYIKTGATLTALNARSWQLTFDRKLVADPAFLNNPDQLDKPGVTDIREVRLRINSLLEQDYNAANKPATEYKAGTQSKFDALYSNAVAVGNKVYAVRFEMPAIKWTAVDNALKDPAVPPTQFEATAILGAFDATSGLPDSLTGDFRILTTVKTTDEPSTDGKFSSL